MRNRQPVPAAVVDAAALRARIEQSRARVAEAQTRGRCGQGRAGGQTTSATSPDHAVTVTVNAAGTLVDLASPQSAAKLPLPSLARSVLATYRRATADAVAETEALLGDLLGFDAPVLDIVRASAPDLSAEERS